MFLSQLAVLCTLPFLAFGMKKRDVSSTSLNFALYGYGPGFGGLPLFYADGNWIGNPNTTLSANSTAVNWSNATFYVPDNTTSDKRVGFLASDASTDGAIETGFFFYGSTAVLIGESGTLESNFYSLQVSERTHRLYWNDTSLGQVPVVLRNIPPSNPPNRG
ncbi:hypothetical protein N0V91_009029 [Didymella pomorum]|uniref:Uncharacterized protein n=1 Tax=Didymella pomorum TaxID=749634 RepID=A0A9W8Z8A0_9PLEO|nr:hypothetical protein N0V91_009029 [Didymella pomorum]